MHHFGRARPSSARVRPKLAQARQTSGQISTGLAHVLSMSIEFGQTLTKVEFDASWLSLTDVGHISAEFDQCWPIATQICTAFGRSRQNLNRTRLCVPNWDDSGLNLADLGPKSVEFGQTGPVICKSRATIDKQRERLADSKPNLAWLGRHFPIMSILWPDLPRKGGVSPTRVARQGSFKTEVRPMPPGGLLETRLGRLATPSSNRPADLHKRHRSVHRRRHRRLTLK